MKVFDLPKTCFVGMYDTDGKFIGFLPVPSKPDGFGSYVDCWNWIYANGLANRCCATEVYL